MDCLFFKAGLLLLLLRKSSCALAQQRSRKRRQKFYLKLVFNNLIEIYDALKLNYHKIIKLTLAFAQELLLLRKSYCFCARAAGVSQLQKHKQKQQ
jgi:hypothetical protein